MPREGRPRSFDEAQVIDQATDLFWRRGYSATSMQRLGQHVGVLPGSLYAALGNKHTLFVRTLERYADGQRELGETLAAADQVLPRLRQALGDVLTAAVDAPGRGCMLGNTAIDLLPTDGVARTIVRRAFRELEESIALALTRAKQTGEVRADVDSTAQARMLVALMQGLHVLARAEPAPQRLKNAIDAAITPLADRQADDS